MARIWGDYGVAAVQAFADVLTLVLALPLAISMTKKIRQAKRTLAPVE